MELQIDASLLRSVQVMVTLQNGCIYRSRKAISYKTNINKSLYGGFTAFRECVIAKNSRIMPEVWLVMWQTEQSYVTNFSFFFNIVNIIFLCDKYLNYAKHFLLFNYKYAGHV